MSDVPLTVGRAVAKAMAEHQRALLEYFELAQRAHGRHGMELILIDPETGVLMARPKPAAIDG
jgi:hypothetical protein